MNYPHEKQDCEFEVWDPNTALRSSGGTSQNQHFASSSANHHYSGNNNVVSQSYYTGSVGQEQLPHAGYSPHLSQNGIEGTLSQLPVSYQLNTTNHTSVSDIYYRPQERCDRSYPSSSYADTPGLHSLHDRSYQTSVQLPQSRGAPPFSSSEMYQSSASQAQSTHVHQGSSFSQHSSVNPNTFVNPLNDAEDDAESPGIKVKYLI